MQDVSTEDLATTTCPECRVNPPEMEMIYRKRTDAGGDHYESLGYVCPAGHVHLNRSRGEDGSMEGVPVTAEEQSTLGSMLQMLRQALVVVLGIASILLLFQAGVWALFFAFPLVISFLVLELFRDHPSLPAVLRLPWEERRMRWAAALPGFAGLLLGLLLLVTSF